MFERFLVRGKRKSDEQWINGYFSPDLDNELVINVHNEFGLFEDSQAIISKTLGQCTGKTDKHAKYYFEDDIVRSDKYHGSKHNVGRVYYDASECSFQVVFIDGSTVPLSVFEGEIIGNIHDNPELLEVQNDR